MKIVFCDMHAEATSEKTAMGWHLDGRASAVVGTHTHIPTADARVLPGGTAYVTDVGMVGPQGRLHRDGQGRRPPALPDGGAQPVRGRLGTRDIQFGTGYH